MNFKTTIFLIVLLLLVGGFFWFMQKKAPNPVAPTSNSTSQGTPFLPADFQGSSVTTIAVDRGHEHLVLQKHGSTWTETSPVHYPLNSWSASDLVDAATGLTYLSTLTPGQADTPSLKTLGLDPPRVILTLTGQNDKNQVVKHVIKLGKTSVAGAAYAMLDDRPDVYVVQPRLHTLLLTTNFDDWRQRTIEAPTAGRAQRVTLATADHTLTLVKNADHWFFAPPDSGRADTASLSSLLSSIGTLEIDKFVADNPSDLSLYGLNQPSVTLTVQEAAPPAAPPATQPGKPAATQPAKPGPIHILRIGSATDPTRDKYFATWSTPKAKDIVVFQISKADKDRFLKTANDLRDPRITVVKKDDLRELTVAAANLPAYKLLWSPSGWTFGKPGPSFATDADQVSRLIDAIFNAKASTYEANPHPAGQPALTLTLSAVGRSEPETIRLWPRANATASSPPAAPAKARYWLALRGQESMGYIVPADMLDPLSKPALWLRDRTVWKIPSGQITGLTIHQPDPAVTLAFQRAPVPTTQPAATRPAASQVTLGPWQLNVDGAKAAMGYEHSAFSTALDDLTSLTCDQWLAKAPAIDPAKALRVDIQTAHQTWTLLVDPASHEARSPQVDAPFQLSDSVVVALKAEFRDRTAINLGSDEIKNVVVQEGSRTITLAKDILGKFVSAEGYNVDQSAAGALFDTLAGLRVNRYLGASVAKPPARTIQITVHPKTGPAIVLKVDGTQSRIYLPNRKQWASVNDATHKKLTADLVAKPAPAT